MTIAILSLAWLCLASSRIDAQKVERITMAVSPATVGVVAFSTLSTSSFLVRLTIFEFLLLALATVLAFIPAPVTMAAAIALFVAVYFWQRKRADAQLSTTRPSRSR